MKKPAIEPALTAAALADLIGVSPRSITDLAKRGIVVRADRGFDRHKSVRGYCDHLRKLATGRGGEAGIATATADRLVRAVAPMISNRSPAAVAAANASTRA
jgi:phage terminase Nu1 subunit (DNA packaging protein)